MKTEENNFIDKSSLSFGDYVMFPGGLNGELTVYELEDVLYDAYGVIPVRITKKFLILNGFVEDETSKGWFKRDIGRFKRIDYDFKTKEFNYDNPDAEKTYCFVNNVKYVHELQHILRKNKIDIKLKYN